MIKDALCKNKHFKTFKQANKILKKNHKGWGNIFECPCGGGYRYTTKSTPKPKVTTPTTKSKKVILKKIDLDFCARSCFRKTRFTDPDIAAKSMRKYGLNGRVYSCDACGGWHFTSQK